LCTHKKYKIHTAVEQSIAEISKEECAYQSLHHSITVTNILLLNQTYFPEKWITIGTFGRLVWVRFRRWSRQNASTV